MFLPRNLLLTPVLISVFALSVDAQDSGNAGAPAEDRPVITLMGMLQPWMYPKAEFGGARTSDAGVTGISSIKSRALLSTDDSVDQVLDFYCKKLNVDREGRNLDEKDGDRITTDRAILVQNASGAEPSNLWLLTINRKKSSTTLVISRDEKEGKTRIAWSNYRQLLP